jgi:catechol O-methyltransferase
MGSWIIRLAEVGGKRMPFLRWSFVRMLLGTKKLLQEWQVGDGREQAVLEYVLSKATAGSLDATIAAIDDYAYHRKFLMNVGAEKGGILDEVIERTRPLRVLEIGAYIGYSASRIARKLPAEGHLYSVELNNDNATIARRVIEHAGASDKVTFVVGALGDGGATVEQLEQLGFATGSVDVVFLDHDKEAYLPDLERILQAGWLKPGSVVVADNVGRPGAPKYKAYMAKQEGIRFRTEKHRTHVEYQTLIPDLVLTSTFLG